MRSYILIIALLLLTPHSVMAKAEQPKYVQALPGNPQSMEKSASVLQFYTFDNGSSPDPQGWITDDLTENPRNHCHVDNFLPALVGSKSMWCGTTIDPNDPETADWVLPGYGDNWHQSWVSRDFIAPPDGVLKLKYEIAWEMEDFYENIFVEYRIDDQDWNTALNYNASSGSDNRTQEVIADPGSVVRFRFRFQSDFIASNASGEITSTGAFLLDELSVTDSQDSVFSYEDFEAEAIGAESTLSGDWSGVIVPGFGNYAGLQAGGQVRQDDPATYNPSNFWSFFVGSPDQYECGADQQLAVPVGAYGFANHVNNEIRSPWIDLDLSENPRSLRIEYDVYLDSPFGDVGPTTPTHQVRILFRDGVTNETTERSSPYYYGEFQAWIDQRIQFNLPPNTTQVQVVFEVTDFYLSSCHRHAPLIDNVQISQTPAFTVTQNSDSGNGSLRWAILEANSNPGPDSIDFFLLFQPAVALQTPLPVISETVSLDGFATVESSPNTLTGASDAEMRAGLRGIYSGNQPALEIQADGCVVSGLSITDFAGPMIKIVGNQNVVRGCWLGFDYSGVPQSGESSHAIQLTYNTAGNPHSVGNRIGGPDPADQNVMGRTSDAVFRATAHDQLVIQGNLVGLAPDGVTAAGGLHGISASSGSPISILNNVVSGNTQTAFSSGLDLNSYADFLVQGNTIGLSGDQSIAVPNAWAGINFYGASFATMIGGCDPGQGNVIAGNGGAGIWIGGSNEILVTGNTIGTNAGGTRQDLGNSGHGIQLDSAQADLFSVGTQYCGNLIAYNGGDGVHVTANFSGAYEILRNEVHGNGGKEIDVSQFDDYSPPPPVMSDAYLNTNQLTATLTLNDLPDVTREFNFFISRQSHDPADPQAEIYVGTGGLVTDGRGEAVAPLTLYGTFLPGDVLTVTTTSLGEASSGLSDFVYLINTPQGTNVVVPLPDLEGTSFPMTGTFDEVTIEGITYGHPGQDTGAPPPDYLTFGIYQFGTTAAWNQDLEICVDYEDSDIVPGQEPNLQLLQMDMEAPDDLWYEITTTFDPVNNTICGQVGALSLEGSTCFALVVPAGASEVPTAKAGLQLMPNVPNPFNPTTEIHYVLPRDGERVTVDIYDLSGRRVRRLFSGTSQAGPQSLTWNGKDDDGRTVVSGVYPLRLVAGKEVRLQNLVLVK